LSPDFRESDWKILRELKTVALDRFCRRILDAVARLSAEPGKSDHQRYLAVYQHIHRRDDDIAAIFNEMTRSGAVLKLCAMRRHDLPRRGGAHPGALRLSDGLTSSPASSFAQLCS
jgi:hypothetical protein